MNILRCPHWNYATAIAAFDDHAARLFRLGRNGRFYFFDQETTKSHEVDESTLKSGEIRGSFSFEALQEKATTKLHEIDGITRMDESINAKIKR